MKSLRTSFENAKRNELNNWNFFGVLERDERHHKIRVITMIAGVIMIGTD
jgi:hypothetical protein